LQKKILYVILLIKGEIKWQKQHIVLNAKQNPK